jgi:putative FmdB family regulatory protein
MPLYEYACDDCQSEFELLIRGDERPTCPSCGGERLEKQWSVPAAHTSRGQSLPMCDAPPRETCGRPQCGMGGCQGLGGLA